MKRLAIFIDGSENDRDSLRSAALFADLTDSHLDVLYPRPAAAAISVLPNGSTALLDDAMDGTGRGAVKSAFDEVCGDMEKARWIDVRGSMDDAIQAFGILYDTIIVERLSEERGPHARAFNTALFETGSPVLVTPPTAPERIGDVVAVVWTGTVQSGRALRSAMPILRAAREVHLLTNTDNKYADPEATTDYLGYHDVAVQHLAFDGSRLTARGRGRAIIEAVRSISADFMIMGAFGDNNIDALFGLGRTTRKLVTAAPVPLFLQS
ncbi:MAG: universal stress protein [Alphaproteobacteria bacterium]|jgi:nucleotide-binding universal stress UspA family protein|nr:universal stress protein [Alphaproteobacteria bacterium]